MLQGHGTVISNVYTSKEKPSCIAMFSRRKRQDVSPASVLQVFQDNQKLLIPLDHLQKIRFQGLLFGLRILRLSYILCISPCVWLKEKCCVHVWLSPNDHVIPTFKSMSPMAKSNQSFSKSSSPTQLGDFPSRSHNINRCSTFLTVENYLGAGICTLCTCLSCISF